MFNVRPTAAALGFAIAAIGLSAQAQPPMQAEDFVNAAAQSDQYEIQAGRLVVVQSENLRIKAFGQEMIDAHIKTSAALKEAAAKSGLPPPPETLGGDQQRMLSALQSAKGPDLDRAYAAQQVNAHAAALVTQQGYAAQGSDPNLLQTAQAAVPLVQHHLQMARQVSASMGDN